MPGHYRQTKIIATLGPATESKERIEQLIRIGVDVLRLNMAHATGEWIACVVDRIRKVSTEVSRHVAIMIDVKGPEIRTGAVSEPIELKVGEGSNSTRKARRQVCAESASTIPICPQM